MEKAAEIEARAFHALALEWPDTQRNGWATSNYKKKKLLSEAFNAMVNTQQLATKQDLFELKHEILKWLVGMMIAQTTLIITAFGIGIAILK